jgi:addiction module RelE/StbE family toxin
MHFIPTTNFKKSLRKAPEKVRELTSTALKLFLTDQYSYTLNNHKLHGLYSDCRSINVNADWRIIYKEVETGTVLLIDINTHSNLYR